MNIFAVHEDPEVAARMLPNKLTVKMPIEMAMMLCTVAHSWPWCAINIPYRSTHKNHPCTKWLGASYSNWRWGIRHGIALCEEYTRRYGRRHACQDVIEAFRDSSFYGSDPGLTKFAMAMPNQYKSDDPVQSYRNYMQAEKSYYAVWKEPGEIPNWWDRSLLRR